MSNFEDFIKLHKEAFDENDVSSALWKRIENELKENNDEKKQSKVIAFDWKKWAIAAAIILIVGTLALSYLFKKDSDNTTIAINNVQEDSSLATMPTDSNIALQPGSTDTENFVGIEPEQKTKRINISPQQANNLNNEEIYHYTRLIEIKQKEMQSLKTQSPELYQQFSSDLEILEQSYKDLKQKLDAGYNTEKVLEAMIQNLKLQADLLNKQLKITKRIKNTKNEKPISI